MAKYVVPPVGKSVPLVKCWQCGTLYAPDNAEEKTSWDSKYGYFEACPICGCTYNDWTNVIPLWKYNLIAFFRGGFRK